MIRLIIVGLFLNDCTPKSNVEKDENTPEHHIDPKELSNIVEAIEIDEQYDNLPPDEQIEKYITNHPGDKNYVNEHKSELINHLQSPLEIDKILEIVEALFKDTFVLYAPNDGYIYSSEMKEYKTRDLTGNTPYFMRIFDKYKQAHPEDITFCDKYKKQIYESWFWQTIEIYNYIGSLKTQMYKNNLNLGTNSFIVKDGKTYHEYIDGFIEKVIKKYPYVLDKAVRSNFSDILENPYKDDIYNLVNLFLKQYGLTSESIKNHIINNFRCLQCRLPELYYLYYRYDSVDPEQTRSNIIVQLNDDYKKIFGSVHNGPADFDVFFGTLSVRNVFLSLDDKKFNLVVKTTYDNSKNSYYHRFQKGDKIQIWGLNGACCGHDKTLKDIIIYNITQNKCSVLTVDKTLPFNWNEQEGCFIVE